MRIDNFREKHGNWRRYIVTILLAIVVIMLGYTSLEASNWHHKLVYSESIHKVAATVNGQELTLLDMAFYVASEEKVAQEQAIVYNPDNPRKYWEVRVNGRFIRVEARDDAMAKAIHDEIFYRMALEKEVELNPEEMQGVKNTQEDFWSDLSDNDSQDRLGVSREDIDRQIEKAALAYKYQIIYAEMNGEAVENYDFSGDSYQDLLKENKYEIEESVWKNVDFGGVTVNW